MGIANTTAAAAIIAAQTGRPPADVTGIGTGIDRARWRRKVAVVERALAQGAVGAEYVRGLALPPAPPPAAPPGAVRPHPPLAQAPSQHEVERELVHYEQYVANRALVASPPAGGA
jgi:nicotinate-nucleotide--dimethylbenzimidazole phosphoribosyltransferase